MTTDAPENGASRGASTSTWLWVVGAVAALALATSTYQVKTGETAIVLRFGNPARVVTEPGLHFKLPAPIDSVRAIDTRTHVLDPAPAEFLTQEQRNLEVDAFVAWRVTDPRQFLVSLRTREGADARIEQVLQSAVNAVLTDSPLSDIVSVEPRERDLARITAEVKELVAQGCEENRYGVEVLYAGFERVTFHRDNMPSIERSMEEDRRRAQVEIVSEGREAGEEIKRAAKLEANRTQSKALADAERIRGEGAAEALRIESAARAANPELYELLKKLELLETLLSGQTIVIPSDHPLWDGVEVPRTAAPKDAAASGEGAGDGQ